MYFFSFRQYYFPQVRMYRINKCSNVSDFTCDKMRKHVEFEKSWKEVTSLRTSAFCLNLSWLPGFPGCGKLNRLARRSDETKKKKKKEGEKGEMYSTPLHSSLKFDATISLNLMDTFTLSYSYETKKKK